MSGDHGIFESSFDCKMMSQAEIESAATSPCRFASLLKKGEVSPQATRLLQLRRNKPIVDMHLVPGGRFLLTQHGDLTINLWDLGCTPASKIPSSPIASLQRQKGIVTRAIASIQPNQEEESTFYLLLKDKHGNQNSSVTVIAVDPFSRTAVFRTLRDRACPPTSNGNNLGVSGNFCVFAIENGYTMWDYVSNVFTSWYCQAWEGGYFITVSPDCVITYDARNFCTWDVRDLPADVRNITPGSQPPNGLSPSFRFQRAHLDDEDLYIYVTHNGWPTGRAMPDVVSMFIPAAMDREWESYLDVYVVERLFGSISGRPMTVPSLKTTTTVQLEMFYDGDMNMTIPPGRFANKTFVQPYCTDDDRSVAAAVLDLTKPGSASAVELCTDASKFFSLCPMSGRLCVLDTKRTRIRVIDFVVPL
ncbi:hypothetical protein H0H93_006813 [Arthromyces matolae]|nr:hypothetical protein H0H93_006813 [Arthromyces matolae]